jgi:NAD(P)-dependent dehydrogenase (short-subunit alcohol dehydrogenase family)
MTTRLGRALGPFRRIHPCRCQKGHPHCPEDETLKETESNARGANPNVEVLSLALEMIDDSSVKVAFGAAKVSFGMVEVVVNNTGLSGSVGHFLHDNGITTRWAILYAPLTVVSYEL